MPIVRLESFDHCLTGELTAKYEGGNAPNDWVLAAVAKKTGVQGLHFNNATPGAGRFTFDTFWHMVHGDGAGFLEVPNKGGCGFWMKFASGHTDNLTQPLLMMGQWSSPTKYYYLRITSGGGLEFRQKEVLDSWTTASLIGTWESDVEDNDLTIVDGQWHYIEVYVGHPNDGADDIYELRVNGVRVAIDDTDPLRLPPAQGVFRKRLFRQEQDVYIDSLYSFIDDATSESRFLGPVNIGALLPDGNGSTNADWTPDNTAHEDIDDAYNDIDDDATKITATGAGLLRHDWDIEDTSAEAVLWLVFQVNARVRVTVSDSATLKAFVIDDSGGGSTTPTVHLDIPESGELADPKEYPVDFTDWKWCRWIGTPDDGLNPTIARLNSMYFGLERLGDGDDTLRITQYVLEVAIADTSPANVRMTQLVVEALVPSPAAEDVEDRTAGPTFIHCTAHGNGTSGAGHGFNGGQTFARCTAYGNADDGFRDPVNIVHGVAYGNTNGVTITHGKPATLLHVACVGNARPFNFVGTPDEAIPYVHMVKCAHEAGDTRITHPAARDAIVYDSDPIDLTADPFVDGANGDFALTGAAGEQLKNFAGTPFFEFPTTKSHHDHQAAQHQCPTEAGTENKFTDNQVNRSVN